MYRYPGKQEALEVAQEKIKDVEVLDLIFIFSTQFIKDTIGRFNLPRNHERDVLAKAVRVERRRRLREENRRRKWGNQ